MSEARNTEDGRQKTGAEAPCDLRQASVALVAALAASDLDATGHALEQRARAIAQGAAPTEEIIALGEHAAALLQDLKRRAGFDTARLGRLQHSFSATAESHIDLRL